jgi:hypothetical protein
VLLGGGLFELEEVGSGVEAGEGFFYLYAL